MTMKGRKGSERSRGTIFQNIVKFSTKADIGPQTQTHKKIICFQVDFIAVFNGLTGVFSDHRIMGEIFAF